MRNIHPPYWKPWCILLLLGHLNMLRTKVALNKKKWLSFNPFDHLCSCKWPNSPLKPQSSGFPTKSSWHEMWFKKMKSLLQCWHCHASDSTDTVTHDSRASEILDFQIGSTEIDPGSNSFVESLVNLRGVTANVLVLLHYAIHLSITNTPNCHYIQWCSPLCHFGCKAFYGNGLFLW